MKNKCKINSKFLINRSVIETDEAHIVLIKLTFGETMKNVLIAVLFLCFASSAFAQDYDSSHRKMMKKGKHGKMMHQKKMRKNMLSHLPDVTDAQKKQFKALKLSLMEKSLPLKNEIGEMKARLRTLSTSDDPKRSKLADMIGEIGELKTKLMVLRMNQKQDMRALLTKEQRTIFDSQKSKMRSGERKHHKMKHSN